MGRKKGRTGQREVKDTGKPDEGDNFNPHTEGFYRDEVDTFHAEREKILLERSEPASSPDSDEEPSDEEEEVLGLQLSDNDSEEGEDEEESGAEFELPAELRKFYASDDDENSDSDPDSVPFPEISAKAWGRSKKAFYSTDYVDDELGGATDEEEAELEEQEALALQQRMAAELDEGDFELGPLLKTKEKDEQTEKGVERVIQDLSKLSREDKLALLEKDSPELFELLEEFEEKFSEALSLRPLVRRVKREPSFLTTQGQEYLETKFHLYLCYCLNIMFYLRLKACKTPVRSHPVIGRIVQIRQLLSQLAPVDKKLEPQVRELMESLTTELPEGDGGAVPAPGGEEDASLENPEGSKKRKRTRVSIKEPQKQPTVEISGPPNRTPRGMESEKKADSGGGVFDPLAYYEQVKAEKQLLKRARREAAERREERGGREGVGEEEEEEDGGKRAITYQIARNKGLTVKRKKEQRNPRVKHRKKFQKALIKRKSQVLPVVPELERYGGERTGIRANLSRSVKIK